MPRYFIILNHAGETCGHGERENGICRGHVGTSLIHCDRQHLAHVIAEHAPGLRIVWTHEDLSRYAVIA